MWNAASRQFFLDQAKPYPYATGGDYVYLYEEGNKTYRVHEFLSTGTSTLNVEVGGEMDILVVGGGGSGTVSKAPWWSPAAGGAGAMIEHKTKLLSKTYQITVGEGGAAVTGNTDSRGSGNDGQNSSFTDGEDLTIVAKGGGGGGMESYNGRQGGSGGGAGYNSNVGSVASYSGPGTQYANPGGQGFFGSSGNRAGGGGGGAGSAGGNALSGTTSGGIPGNGGSGRMWLNGKYYAGGGGSGNNNNYPPGSGGIGGGGSGGSLTNAENGSPNTGGGGGSAGSNSATTLSSGAGGSGIVIVRYVVAEKKLWTPSELTSLKAWWDAADETTIFDATSGGSLPNSGNDIARWEDKSGGGYHVTQATAANRPHYVTNTLNGKPVIECTSQWLEASTASDWKFLHDSTGSTVIAVWKPGNTTSPDAAYALLGNLANAGANIGAQLVYENRTIISLSDEAVGAAIGRGDGTRVLWYFTPGGSNTIFSEFNNLAVSNSVSINAFVMDPSNATGTNRLKVNRNGGTLGGNQTFTATPSTSNPTYPLQIGAAGNNSIPLTGYIGEVVICNAVISNADRQKLEGYLAHKWGLTNNLPAGHPYKYEPPYKVEPEEIVTDGLVLNLDAGDYASYPRSGTTWYDISGNGNNGTLTNGPTYDSANKGSIVFDGSDDYNLLPNLALSYPFTISLWSKGNSTITFSDPTVDNKSIGLGFSGGVNNIRCYYYSPATGFIAAEEPANSTTIYNICGVYTSSGFDLYVNGQYKSTLSGAKSKVWTDTLGSYNMNRLNRLSVIYYSGNSYACQIYNRALSSTEISQNFNALRGRYGI